MAELLRGVAILDVAQEAWELGCCYCKSIPCIVLCGIYAVSLCSLLKGLDCFCPQRRMLPISSSSFSCKGNYMCYILLKTPQDIDHRLMSTKPFRTTQFQQPLLHIIMNSTRHQPTSYVYYGDPGNTFFYTTVVLPTCDLV